MKKPKRDMVSRLRGKPPTFNLKLSPRQLEFFRSNQKFVLYGGAKGGGKSYALRWRQILRRLKHAKSRGLLLRRTHPELRRSHIDKLHQELPKSWGVRFSRQENTFTFPNGSVLELGSCQYESDVYNYQGAEYDDIAVDEATQFTRFQFDILRSCLRTINPNVQTQFYLGANPGGVGHLWVKKEFIDAEKSDDHAFIPAKVYDNPVLMRANPEYVKTLESLPEKLRKAFLDGDWNIFEGQAFPEWGMGERHIRSAPDYPIDQCRRVVGFDWGYNDPGCAVWVAFAPTGHAYIYRELYQSKKDPEKWARELAGILRHESVQGVVLPHDCFSRQGGWDSVAETFMRFNIRPIVRGKTLNRGMRHNRKAILHRYLSDHADGEPYLLIDQSCVNGIRTLPSLIYSATDPEDISSGGEDHFYDALTLALVSFGEQDPSGSTGVSIRPTQSGHLPQTWPLDDFGDPLFPTLKQFVSESDRQSGRRKQRRGTIWT